MASVRFCKTGMKQRVWIRFCGIGIGDSYEYSVVSGAYDQGKADDAGKYQAGGSDFRACRCKNSL